MSGRPVRRGLAVIALWLLLLAAAVWQITRTDFVADLSAFLPANPDPQQQVLIEQLQSGLPARTLLIGIDGGNAVQRAEASRRLAAALRGSGLFEQVQNGETQDWADVGTWLFEHRYLLSPAIDEQRFSAAGLRDGIEETLSLLGTPVGNAIKPLLDRDPTGETQRIAESLIPAGAPRSEHGVWVSRQGERALLIASTKAPGADLDQQAVAIERVRSEFAALKTSGLTLQMSGAPVFGVDSRAKIESETHWLALVGTVAVTLILLVVFASLRALLVAMLPVATGVLAGVSLVAVSFGSVHGITLGFGTTLIGEAVDYAIYYLIQARSANGSGGWRAWLRTGWPTVRLGLLTSLCGFGALVFSGFPGLAQLGVFSVAGLLGAALTTRFVLPVLMPDGASSTRGHTVRVQMARLTGAMVSTMPRLRWPLLALGVAAAVLLSQRGDLWQAELSALSPISKQALELDKSLRADLSAGDARTLVVVQATDLQTTLQRAEQAAARLEPLVDQGVIGGWDSVTRWLPSLQLQAQRRAALPAAPALHSALLEATSGGPLSAQRLAPFVDEVQRARTLPPITPASLQSGSLKPLVDALLLQRPDGSAAALLMLQPAPGKEGRIDLRAVQLAMQGLAGTQTLDIGGELTRLYAHYLREAQLQALLGALGVVLLMAAWLRSWRRLVAVCQPLVLAVLITMGGLAALNVQLGILHLVGLLLVVAVGSNYALFFDMLRQHPGEPDSDTLASLLLANGIIVLSFGLLAFSAIPALSAIGRVVAPGTLLALLLSAAFASGRLAAARPNSM
ncbi:MAG TPA: MMPL family transporter [Rubrivivax sp.]|nr:MMPL family transporter [Rubrivivax sp.]